MEKYAHCHLVNGVPRQEIKVMRLKGKELNDWEISRIYLSKRSYCPPRSNYDEKKVIKE